MDTTPPAAADAAAATTSPPSTIATSSSPPQPPQPQLQPQPQSQPRPLLSASTPEAPASLLPSQQQISASAATHLQQFQPLSQQRPSAQRPRPPYSAFPSSSAPPPTPTSTGLQRGGMALGVPAQPRQQQQGSPVPFSSFGPNPSFGQPFVGMSPRLPEQNAASTSQVRTPVQGVQTIGMVGSLSNAPSMRPSGHSLHHQMRAGPMQLRSTSPASTQLAGSQKLPGQGLMRTPSMTSLGPQSTGQLQNSQSPQQPWVSSQGKSLHSSSIPSPAYRPQVRPQQLQQKPSLPQQTAHVQHQQLQSQQPQIQQKQAPIVTKSHQTITQQHLSTRTLGSAIQKTVLPSTAQPGMVPPGSAALADADDSCDRILRKRSIHELVAQVDPSEKLDSDVENLLVEIADDFVETVTTFACSLAKHRKSTILEAKDVLLHLEKNWNMTLPGFGGDEIKYYKKPLMNEIHKDRLSAIKKSMIGAPDPGSTKNSTPGQAAAGVKSHQVKIPVISSPKLT